MLALGRFAINATHVIDLDVPTAELRIELTDPRDDTPIALEGAVVRLRGPDGTPISADGTTDRDGDVSLLITNVVEGAIVEIDFEGGEFLDLDAQAFIAATDLAPIETRPLLRMPPRWRSDEQATLFDDLGGRVQNGTLPMIEKLGQGTQETPWVIRLDHAWTRLDVVFEFYDVVAAALSRLEGGVMLEAFDSAFEDAARVGGGTTVDGDQRHALRLFRDVAPDQLILRLSCPQGAYLDLNTAGIPLARVRQEPEGETATLREQLERYALPQTWISRGQFASLDGGTNAAPFEQVVAKLLEGGKTVTFDLDDVLLVDEERKPVKIAQAIPVSVFGRDFEIKRRDAIEPQHSDVIVDRALQRGRDLYHFDTVDEDGVPRPHAVTRVIRRGKKIYHLDGSRTLSGKVVGVRAAIRDAHPKMLPLAASIKGGFPCQAAFHFFDDVGVVDVDGVEHTLRVVLVQAVVRLRPNPGSGIETSELNRIREVFSESAARWTGEPLSIVFGSGTPHGRQTYVIEEAKRRATKFVFAFPTIAAGRGTIAAFLVKKRKDFRAHAGPLAIHLNVNSDLESSDHTSSVEDGISTRGLVIAHELGHTLGLPDEYLETNKLGVPQFTQLLRGLLHSFQDPSIMRGNHLPMLRHAWSLAQLLHKRGHLDGKHHVFCDTRRLGLPAGRVHRYVHHATKSPFDAIAKLKVGPKHGRYNAIVGVLGDDFDVTPGVSRVDGVVILSPRIYLRFRGKHDPSAASTTPKTQLAGRIRAALVEAISDTPRILKRTTGGTTSTLPRRLLVRLEPRFSTVNVAAADLRVHFMLATKKPGHPTYAQRLDKVTLTDENNRSLARHLLGVETQQQAHFIAHGGGATLKFDFEGVAFTLTESDTQTSGNRDYVARRPNPKGGFLPLTGPEVAANITTAINDTANGLTPFVSATASGNVVRLTKGPDAVEIDAYAIGSAVTFAPSLLQEFEPSDFNELAKLVSAELGETFEVMP